MKPSTKKSKAVIKAVKVDANKRVIASGSSVNLHALSVYIRYGASGFVQERTTSAFISG
jgi:hypothetical protein